MMRKIEPTGRLPAVPPVHSFLVPGGWSRRHSPRSFYELLQDATLAHWRSASAGHPRTAQCLADRGRDGGVGLFC
ncbi:MAG: hypothetical protein HQL87_14055 [Magnetococcales bacterium]|nr:hypothetical protein [Magnetococcales bacterium]